MDTLRHYLTQLRASLLVLPLLMAAAALAAAWMLLGADLVGAVDRVPRWIHVGNAQSARNLLSALLTGIITMFSLVLSITMVVLALAAQQLGSRLIRNFMEDRATQAVIGLFLGTSLYLLVVLAAIDDTQAQHVPHAAVTVALLLSGICLPALLYYVDRLARSIVFDHAASRIATELRGTCAHMQRDASRHRAYGPPLPEQDPEAIATEAAARGGWLTTGSAGYVQSISYDSLVEAARRCDAQIRIDVRPGQWVNADTRCIAVLPAATPDLARRIRRAVIIGPDRTPTQDLEYGLQRLVEMAVRALSPGVNDVFTALAAIDNLGASVALIFSHPMPPPVLHDAQGRIRVIRMAIDPTVILNAAFDQVRQAGAAMPAVGIRLFDALGRLAPNVGTSLQRDAILEQIDAVHAAAGCDRMIPMDVAALRERHRRARTAIAGLEIRSAPD